MPQIKTAISIRQDLFEQASRVAEEMDLPRSGLFELAIDEFLQRYKNLQLLAQINAAYNASPTEEEQENLARVRALERTRMTDEAW
jgi:metal-responsive CopG/Arc/MetJ family transcriptional regulator